MPLNCPKNGAPLSLPTTCKRLAIDPYAYLRDIFGQISAHKHSELDALLPDKWKAGRATTHLT